MRKCSQCGSNGHNSRTCCKGCTSFKLFGVKINVVPDESPPPPSNNNNNVSSIRRTKSLESLLPPETVDHRRDARYLSSDDLFLHSARSSSKKGSTWSEEEHRAFLVGLEKLGKGDWRGISRTYVPSRTPTQVASHAQKYFIRISCLDKKKRRTSVFDMPLNQTTTTTSTTTMEQQNGATQGIIPSPSSDEPAPHPDPPKQATTSTSVSPPSKNDESNAKVLERVDDNKGLQNPPKGKPYSVSKHQRPPIPPPPLLVVPSFNCMPYMSGRMIPAVSWAPLPPYPNQRHGGYGGNFHGHYAAASCVQYMSSSPQSAALPPLVSGPPPSSKQDGLHLPFGALTL
ncbi:unnamed protein product [Cuscuta campestris]|uniref:HTH myb-type domain-containing protein n=1 Tax=Cuscuta campestris TaxID=132261 RepID=A0A484NF77_9ASTE|nr:unnamed protein product [Cuscuta campestris]